MTDEEFIFHEDSRDKKRTAYSANKKPVRNSRRCHFPSDYKTKKELNQMSGEVMTYDLSKPMKWGAFSDMPADLQKKYLSSLQLKYHATAMKMSEMFGVSRSAVSIRMRSLGVSSLPRGARVYPEWESFLKYGTPTREASAVKELIPPEVKAKLDKYEEKHPPAVIENADKPKQKTFRPFAVPVSGDIRLKGTAAMIGETLYLLTGGENISCRISWETIQEG